MRVVIFDLSLVKCNVGDVELEVRHIPLLELLCSSICGPIFEMRAVNLVRKGF